MSAIATRTASIASVVTRFIRDISERDSGLILDSRFKYLCLNRYGVKELDKTVENIDTVLFCQLFPQYGFTTVERYLRQEKSKIRARKNLLKDI